MPHAIARDPDTMRGIPVFAALFEYREGGDSRNEFVDGFPTVSRAPALDAPEEARMLCCRRIVDAAEAAGFEAIAVAKALSPKNRRTTKLS